jgi:hypothetical protein
MRIRVKSMLMMRKNLKKNTSNVKYTRPAQSDASILCLKLDEQGNREAII